MSYPPQGMPAAEVGGLYGINVETLAGDKTLTPGTDKMYQYLDEGGADRIITLATAGAAAGDRFVIRHNGGFNDIHKLTVNQSPATLLDEIYAGAIKEFIFDGTNWKSRGVGTGESGLLRHNVAVGHKAQGYDYGTAVGESTQGYKYAVAVGHSSQGYDYGVAVGGSAQGYTSGVAVGYDAQGHTRGVAVGRSAKTNAKKYAIALGYCAETERTGETSTNINGDDSDQENNVVQGRWAGDTTTATPLEIFCAGQADERFTIRPSSVLAFDMIIVARCELTKQVARYSVHDGLIKRDDANNTAIVLCTVEVDYEDVAGWDCAVTADDFNEALIITVTGEAIRTIQWAAVMNGVETHF